MAPKALRVLAHVAPLRARLRRWDQPGEHTLVATNRSLEFVYKKKNIKSIKIIWVYKSNIFTKS